MGFKFLHSSRKGTREPSSCLALLALEKGLACICFADPRGHRASARTFLLQTNTRAHLLYAKTPLGVDIMSRHASLFGLDIQLHGAPLSV